MGLIQRSGQDPGMSQTAGLRQTHFEYSIILLTLI